MSILPELIIQDILVKNIRELRREPWRVYQLFRTAPQTLVHSFHETFSNTPLDITLGYARTDTRFPCLCIILRGEQESDILLGDFLSGGYEASSIYSPGSEELFYTSGESSSSDTLGEKVLGEPRRLFDTKGNKYIEQFGSGVSTSYAIQIMSTDQDYTLFLYGVIRHIISRNILTFEKNGMLEMSIGGSDFLPQATHEPNFIYIRNVSMSFLNFVDYFIDVAEEKGIAKGFVIDITGDAGTDPFSHFASMQSPHVRNLYSLEGRGPAAAALDQPLLRKVYDPSQKSVVYAYDTSPQSIVLGGIARNLVAAGLNLKINSSVQLRNEQDEYLVILGADDFPIFLSTQPGTVASTTTTFVAAGTDSIPFSVKEDMFMRVIAPDTHGAFEEERRIDSILVGAGGTITVSAAFSAELDGATVMVLNRDAASHVDIIDEIHNVMFVSSFTGQTGSSILEFKSVATEVVPSNLLEGMILEVISPDDHVSYKERRRITGSVSGPGGTITVASAFSASLVGARVQVTEKEDFLRFSVYVPTDVSTGSYDLKVTNSDLLSDTLVGGLTVA